MAALAKIPGLNKVFKKKKSDDESDDEFDDGEVEVTCEVVRSGEIIASKAGLTGQNHLNMPDGLFHLERSLFSRIPLKNHQLQILYWGTPIVFSDADLASGLLEGDTVRMTFSGVGELENPVVPLPDAGQLLHLRGVIDPPQRPP